MIRGGRILALLLVWSLVLSWFVVSVMICLCGMASLSKKKEVVSKLDRQGVVYLLVDG